MNNSILNTIKEMMGIEIEETAFDNDIIVHINTVFFILNQLGVGPTEPFIIRDEYATWDNFISDSTNLESIKTYMYLKVKLLFDPPQSSSHVEALKQSASEFEWRLNLVAESET